MNYSTLSPYYNTPMSDGGYLDILQIRPVPAYDEDIEFEITSSYQYRPDLLAFDLYGKKELWWVFIQRNPDIIYDPVFDFVAGTKIRLPQGDKLKEMIGY